MEIIAENKNARVEATIEVTAKTPMNNTEKIRLMSFICSRFAEILGEAPFLACHSISINGIKVK